MTDAQFMNMAGREEEPSGGRPADRRTAGLGGGEGRFASTENVWSAGRPPPPYLRALFGFWAHLQYGSDKAAERPNFHTAGREASGAALLYERRTVHGDNPRLLPPNDAILGLSRVSQPQE